MASNKVETGSGTINDTISHLLLWCSRPGGGLARVEYFSDHAVEQCAARLREELTGQNLPVSDWRLPGGLTPARLVRLWLYELNETQARVINITGFPDAFTGGPGLEEELLQLNYFRERLAEPSVKQIWWMPVSFAEKFLRAAPDLNSWFTKRLRLEERIEGLTYIISHADADRAWAEWIALQLKRTGIAARLQTWDFRSGSDFARQIDRGREEADRIITVLTRNYLHSRFAISEWEAALARDAATGDRKIIPVRVQQFDLPSLPAETALVDLAKLPQPEARKKLLAGVGADVAVAATGTDDATSAEDGGSERFPGSLSRIWNIPHDRNPHFIGREELMSHLRSALLSGSSTSVAQVMTGLGGVGKSQAAIEYAFRHVDDFDVVWWMRSEQPATLADDFAALAGPLGLPEKDSRDQELIIAAVREWLERHNRWLLIFDNANQPEDLEKYFPRNAAGQVLVTSRNPDWKGRTKKLPVELFRHEESVRYLLQRAGRTNRESTEAEMAAEREAAEWLAEELGNLPLKLELAASYLRSTGTTLKDYLRLLQHASKEGISTSVPSEDSRRNVDNVFRLSLEKARKLSERSESLLYLSAFLAPDDIPLDLLFDGTVDLSERPDLAPLQESETREKALSALCEYLLMDRSGETVSMHRLVQAAVFDHLSQQDRQRFAGSALLLLNEHLPVDVQTNVSSWPTYARLLTHGLAAVQHVDNLPAEERLVMELLNKFGEYLLTRAQFSQAEPMMRRALAIDEQSYGPEHPYVAIRLNNLAQLLQATNRLAFAEPLLRRSVSIFSVFGRHTGHQHPSLSTVIGNYRSLLAAMKLSEDEIERRIAEATG